MPKSSLITIRMNMGYWIFIGSAHSRLIMPKHNPYSLDQTRDETQPYDPDRHCFRPSNSDRSTCALMSSNKACDPLWTVISMALGAHFCRLHACLGWPSASALSGLVHTTTSLHQPTGPSDGLWAVSTIFDIFFARIFFIWTLFGLFLGSLDFVRHLGPHSGLNVDRI